MRFNQGPLYTHATFTGGIFSGWDLERRWSKLPVTEVTEAKATGENLMTQ